MDKRKEIPAKSKPNAASKSDVDRALARAAALGLDIHVAMERAGLSYATRYRVIGYSASVATLRKFEEWLVKEESKRRLPARPTSEQQDENVSEWGRLGQELSQIDPVRFSQALEGIRDLVDGIKLEERGIRKMFRGTPDAER